jgi:hypothetical protein
MSELKEFVKKRTASFSGISSRKLYGLDAFYLNELPFIVITSDEQIVVKVYDSEVKKSLLTIHKASQWSLSNKVMESWFVLPNTFNKKKNKLSPILDITSKALLNPKKIKKKRIKKPKNEDMLNTPKNVVIASPSFFKRILKLITG